MISEMEKEVERIRDWCAEDYKKNMSEMEKFLWKEVDKFREKHKNILKSLDAYDEAVREYKEAISDKVVTKDSDDIKV